MPRGKGPGRDRLWLRALPVRINDPLNGTVVRRSITGLAGVAVIAAALSGPASWQGMPRTIFLMKADPQTLTAGYRICKVVGSAVVVPYSSLEVRDKRIVLPGATKESRKSLPEFQYSD